MEEARPVGRPGRWATGGGSRRGALLRLEPARTDQGDFWPTGPPHDDGDPPPVDLVDQCAAFAAEGELMRAGMQCMPRDQRSPFDLSA